MAQKVFRTGNSLAVTVPSEFAASVGVRAGATVQVKEEKEKARLTYQFVGVHQLPLAEDFLARRKTK